METHFCGKCDALKQLNGSHIIHLVEIDDDNDETNVTSQLSMKRVW